jgi:hypothetical protein
LYARVIDPKNVVPASEAPEGTPDAIRPSLFFLLACITSSGHDTILVEALAQKHGREYSLGTAVWVIFKF